MPVLKELLKHPLVQNYKNKWGLDFLLPLVAKGLGYKSEVVQIENGRYDPARRPHDKVKTQYDTYLDIIKQIAG